MIFDVKQKRLIESDKPKILCIASSASGKTATLTERIRHLVKVKKVNPKDIVAITFTKLAAAEMRMRLEDVATEEMFIGTVHSYALKVCGLNEISMYQAINEEEYDRILKTAIDLPSEKYVPIKHLLIDESQDLTLLEYAFIDKIPTENIFYVGDPRQCQPAGTKVRLHSGLVKNIEDIKVGDSVVWYDNTYGIVGDSSINEEHKVLRIASRDFSKDELITVYGEEGSNSRYTPNHICFARLSRSKYFAVYLIYDNKEWKFKVDLFPYPRGESGQIWILEVFHTEGEALALEKLLNNRYRTFLKTKNRLAAQICLKEFHRNLYYPMYENGDFDELGYVIHQPRELFAANLIPDVMSLVVYVPDEFEHKTYERISKIEYEYIEEPIKVYSLEVEGGTYVADDIITHNCIYQFKGGSDRFILEKYEDPTYTNYFLDYNYRNPPNILDFANSFINKKKNYGPDSTPVKTELGGLEEELSLQEALEYIYDSSDYGNWAILTRTNNESEVVQYNLYKNDVNFITFKKSDFDNPDQIDRALAENAVKVLTMHTSKGLEFPNVIVVGARVFNEAEANLAYVAATRAKNNLYWCKPLKIPRGRTWGVNMNFKEKIKNDPQMIEF